MRLLFRGKDMTCSDFSTAPYHSQNLANYSFCFYSFKHMHMLSQSYVLGPSLLTKCSPRQYNSVKMQMYPARSNSILLQTFPFSLTHLQYSWAYWEKQKKTDSIGWDSWRTFQIQLEWFQSQHPLLDITAPAPLELARMPTSIFQHLSCYWQD